MVTVPLTHEATTMPFADRLAAKRKEHGLNQQQLANLVDVHVTQLRRYEAGTAKPNLDVLRRIALALQASIDSLAFDEDERGPEEDLRMEFEAIASFSPEEKRTAKAILKGLILKHQAERWADRPAAS